MKASTPGIKLELSGIVVIALVVAFCFWLWQKRKVAEIGFTQNTQGQFEIPELGITLRNKLSSGGLLSRRQ